jgi:dipeptide/tripeptide permease
MDISPLRNPYESKLSVKTRLLAFLVTTLSFAALAQGTVYFSNRTLPGVDAPMYFPKGVTEAMISQLTVELMAGTNPTQLTSVATVGFLTNSAGCFDGGVVPTLVPVTTNAFFQIRFRTPETGTAHIYDGFCGARHLCPQAHSETRTLRASCWAPTTTSIHKQNSTFQPHCTESRSN